MVTNELSSDYYRNCCRINVLGIHNKNTQKKNHEVNYSALISHIIWNTFPVIFEVNRHVDALYFSTNLKYFIFYSMYDI